MAWDQGWCSMSQTVVRQVICFCASQFVFTEATETARRSVAEQILVLCFFCLWKYSPKRQRQPADHLPNPAVNRTSEGWFSSIDRLSLHRKTFEGNVQLVHRETHGRNISYDSWRVAIIEVTALSDKSGYADGAKVDSQEAPFRGCLHTQIVKQFWTSHR